VKSITEEVSFLPIVIPTNNHTTCNNNNLLISKIKQVNQLPSYRTRSATLPFSEPMSTTTTGHYIICCKNLSLNAPEDGQKSARNVVLILEINKLLLLYLVGFSILLFLHWWCTVKHKSKQPCLPAFDFARAFKCP